MNLQHAERRRSLCASGPDSSLVFSLQALLLRHEEFVVHAAEEREDLHNRVTDLNGSHAGLTAKNVELCEENLALKRKVGELEDVVLEANQRNEILKGMLGDAEAEVQRLATFARRTEALEAQLGALEAKQRRLQRPLQNVEIREDQENSLLGRPRSQTESQFHTLKEKTKRKPLLTVPEDDDREKKFVGNNYGEATSPSNKRADSLHVTPRGSTVVSNFVEGLLSDNANMQVAMAKQAETLSKLQEEVDHLRERVSFPSLAQQARADSEDSLRRTSITSERILGSGRGLGIEFSHKLQKPREVHVHHHYHGPPPPAIQPNTTLLGRSKSQSYAGGPGTRRFPVAVPSLRSSSAAQAPSQLRPPLHSISNNVVSHSNLPTTPVTTVKISADKQPQTKTVRQPSNRYSASSTQTGVSFPVSSNPSSPQSLLFEQSPISNDSEYSRPTSRGSSVVWHPGRGEAQSMAGYDASLQEEKQISKLASGSSYENSHLHSPVLQPRQPSGNEIPRENALSGTQQMMRPNHLQRTPSLLSISGMDIHTSFAAPFSPSSSFSSTSAGRSFISVANRLPSPSASTIPPAIISPVLAIVEKSSSRARKDYVRDQQQAAKQETKENAATTPVGALSQSLIGRGTAMPEPDHKLKDKPKSQGTTDKPLAKLDDDVYSPLFDTFGKRVGGWLTGKFAGGGPGDQVSGARQADPNENNQKVPKPQKSATDPRRTISDYATPSSRPGSKPDMARTRTVSSSSKTAKATTIVAIEAPDLDPAVDSNKRLLESAGIDPVNGLPALRQVSGMKSPQLLGGVDQDALRECLMDLSDVSGGEDG